MPWKGYSLLLQDRGLTKLEIMDHYLVLRDLYWAGESATKAAIFVLEELVFSQQRTCAACERRTCIGCEWATASADHQARLAQLDPEHPLADLDQVPAKAHIELLATNEGRVIDKLSGEVVYDPD